MTKKEVAAILEDVAMLLDLSGENPFKARTYINVARALEQSEIDLETLVREKRLREIKGVGDALEQKIEEIVTTGALAYRDELRAKYPVTLFDLFRIPGLGAKRIKILYDDLKITSLEELEHACGGAVANLKGFGEKTQQKILEGIAFAQKHRGLYLVHTATDEAERLRDWLTKGCAIVRMEIAGSLRRGKEVVKDIDIIASSKTPEKVMARFTQAPFVERITGSGNTKSSVVLRSGIAADLRVVSDAQFPYALHHFTGSKEHNVALRQRANEYGLKMNEYGLFKEDDTLVKCKDEASIFKALDLPYIPPEIREDMGETSLTETPRLVERADLAGVIHCHSTYSDGTATIEQMARGAMKRGYSYIVLADHSQTAAYAGGLVPAAVRKQHREIDALNAALKGVRIVKGIESDIRADGSLDYDDDVLGRFELIIASVHSGLNMSEAEATKRVVAAVECPYTAVLGHLTGRLLLAREGYPLNMDKVVDACVRNRVAIEINADPHRLDMDWRHIKRARDNGAMFSIGPDAHSVEGLDNVRYGIGIARKGWLGPEHVINCMAIEELLAWRKGK